MDEPDDRVWRIQIYVAGDSVQSRRAKANLDAIIDRYDGAAEVTVIDLFDDPEAASERDILAIPTLIRDSPLPALRIIGDLSDTERVLSLLMA